MAAAAGRRTANPLTLCVHTLSHTKKTPSLVPPPLLGKLLSALQRRFGLSPSAEVSMEADPGTFDAPRLAAYAALGVNRFSVGVQSFDEVGVGVCQGGALSVHEREATRRPR